RGGRAGSGTRGPARARPCLRGARGASWRTRGAGAAAAAWARTRTARSRAPGAPGRCRSRPQANACEGAAGSRPGRPPSPAGYPREVASKLPTKLRIAPQTRLSGRVNVPGSKSLTNRALPLAALAQGTTTVTGALVAEDSEVMLRALQQLGVELEARGETVVVHGAGGPLPASGATLDLRLSGTSLRFLTAVLAAGHGEYVLDGTARMRERPVGDLLDALGQLGADASGVDGRPPVTLRASGLRGGAVRVRGDVSSQFLSGLLMAAPLASAPVSVEVEGELLSKPFVDMTLDVMAHFGVAARRDGYRRFELEPAGYVARDYRVEGDAMAAGYFWAAAAVTGGSVTVCNLGAGTRQGDARFAAVLEQMGCQVAWTPDTVAVTGPRRLRGG